MLQTRLQHPTSLLVGSEILSFLGMARRSSGRVAALHVLTWRHCLHSLACILRREISFISDLELDTKLNLCTPTRSGTGQVNGLLGIGLRLVIRRGLLQRTARQRAAVGRARRAGHVSRHLLR